MKAKIKTEDGVVLEEGDAAYNYYDMKPGHIVEGTVGENGGDLWFTFKHTDGSTATLNGQRLCTSGFAVRRGFKDAG